VNASETPLPLLLALAFACGQPAPPAPAECPPPAPCPEAGLSLAPWEASLLDPVISDLRAGVRPADAQSFGICRGKTTCEEQLGPSPGELPPGDYVLRADLLVPRVGEGWAVEMAVNCEITTKTGKVSKWSDKRTHPLRWAGEAEPIRLTPLWSIHSPNSLGARRCEYTLTPIRPDGERAEALSGAWSTPSP